MQTATGHHYQSSAGYRSPVDDQTYDLLQALVSKCEAIEAYAKYEQDSDDQGRQLFQQLGEQDARAAEQLLDALRTKIGASSRM
ncbi:MAG: hypothetical protein M3Y40_08355 [Chloroflexota bacterium]|nr:hypothetical protein [Chloroflexota bacterium]